ncbi:hypothetical protein CK226_20825 [Mesorhizobium sp. WSM4311]|nr:hypothetical protein CK226_20825 [Mesorhizobium sp. WSM4311]
MYVPIGYHYSNEDYEDGRIVVSGRDNMDGLTEIEKKAELFLRAAHEEGEALRKGALYLWQDLRVAKYLWEFRGKTSDPRKYLYTMKYDEVDFIHAGDLRHYTVLKDAVKEGKPLEDATAARYWDGPPAEAPQMEILVTKATVKSRIELPQTPADVMRKFFEQAKKG